MGLKAFFLKSLLLVIPFDPAFILQDSCLSTNYFGNYRDGQSIYSVLLATVPDSDALPECMAFWESRGLMSIHYTTTPSDGRQLVWLEEKAVDEKLKLRASHESNLDVLLNGLRAPLMPSEQSQQEVIAISEGDSDNLAFELYYSSATAALVSVSKERARIIDTLLPPFWRSTILPATPVSYQPVPPSASKRVSEILSNLKFDPVVASVVNNISIPQIKKDIRFLTGEDETSGIISRHSFSDGARTAANWLKARIEETGAKCHLSPFLIGFAPNVICRYSAIKDTNDTVLISAHYDSRGSFGSIRAPGGDDDGSGTVGILSIARTIARKKVLFQRNVELALFAGEEQGLFGSKAYARELREANASLILMVQADMIAYRAPGEPSQLGLPDRIGSTEVTQLVANISAIYSPELTVGYTSACCSDHQSFHEQGFPATQVFERAGPIADPMYHNSGDLSDREGYDFDQLYSIAKVQFATVLHAAGFEIAK
ncbi:Zn-dependent exopeptidase [Phlegmacium glaucopus]|nr:Zn-dependent exopeptidase [Phlegmacium glaucopus]